MKEIIKEIEEFHKKYWKLGEFELPTKKELEFFNRCNSSPSSVMYMPHKNQYQDTLKMIDDKDVVIDMGCGDLRLALMLSEKAKKVYAVELNIDLIHNILKIINYDIPQNLIVICCDWMYFPIPKDVNKIVCLVNSPIIPIEWLEYDLILGRSDGEVIQYKENKHDARVILRGNII